MNSRRIFISYMSSNEEYQLMESPHELQDDLTIQWNKNKLKPWFFIVSTCDLFQMLSMFSYKFKHPIIDRQYCCMVRLFNVYNSYGNLQE